MPALVAKYASITYTSASQLPQSVWDTFRAHPRESNIMYPHALKALARERSGLPVRGNVWITCTSSHSDSDIDLVLSCSEGPMGSYPVFIFSPRSPEEMDFTFLFPRILRLVYSLRRAVPSTRVYSVFASDRITKLFVGLWSRIADVTAYNDPYYHARFTYCTQQTLSKRQMTIHPDLAYELRPAVEADILEAAELCHGFASESEPFTLTKERAIEEATLLVLNKQLWVHRIRRSGGLSDIASIVAITRESAEVSAITKVYTNPNWRRLGCAERLVRRVCKHLLTTKRGVVLYVAHNNPAAAKVYHRVGFAGLNGQTNVKGVSSWLEIGFDRNEVTLGHW